MTAPLVAAVAAVHLPTVSCAGSDAKFNKQPGAGTIDFSPAEQAIGSDERSNVI